MTSYADDFLNDLNDTVQFEAPPVAQAQADTSNKAQENASSDEDDENMQSTTIDVSGFKLKDFAKVLSSDVVISHLAQIDHFIATKHEPMGGAGLLEDPEYPIILGSNKILVDMDDEMAILHKYLRDLYAKKFAELEAQVLTPMDYARVVKRIGNALDIARVDMSDILPNSVTMVIKVSASTSNKTALSEQDLSEVLATCDAMLQLDETKKKILQYISSRMHVVAPNLSAIVGTSIAAQLIGAAGGLTNLSKTPAANVQCLGKQRKILTGFSAKTTIRHIGFIGNCDIVNNTPPALRKRAGRIVSTKSTLAARMDSFHSASDGAQGKKLRQEIEDAIRKLQEAPPARQEKPLPAPDDKRKPTRGGENARRLKKLYGMTEMRQKANRMKFGEAEAEDFMTGKGFGLLGQDSGSLRMQAKTKVKQTSKQKKDQQKAAAASQTPFYGNQSISGLASSLAFTPVQGMQLDNPENSKKRAIGDNETKDKYFGSTSFSKVKKQKTDMAPPPAKKA